MRTVQCSMFKVLCSENEKHKFRKRKWRLEIIMYLKLMGQKMDIRNGMHSTYDTKRCFRWQSLTLNIERFVEAS